METDVLDRGNSSAASVQSKLVRVVIRLFCSGQGFCVLKTPVFYFKFNKAVCHFQKTLRSWSSRSSSSKSLMALFLLCLTNEESLKKCTFSSFQNATYMSSCLFIVCGFCLAGVFLICWLPFFVTHILNTHCRACHIPPEVYGTFTWLGYVNSALNPVIYTTFNIEFRRAFIKILSC